jgi:hypothetical protein
MRVRRLQGMQRMAWFLGHLASEDAVPFGHELSVASSVGHLVRAAAELGHDCPVPTAVACTWAAAQLQICDIGGFQVRLPLQLRIDVHGVRLAGTSTEWPVPIAQACSSWCCCAQSKLN